MSEAAGDKLATINIQCDPQLRAATDEYVAAFNESAETRASIRSTVECSLKAYLRERGFWPRKKKGAARPRNARV